MSYKELLRVLSSPPVPRIVGFCLICVLISINLSYTHEVLANVIENKSYGHLNESSFTNNSWSASQPYLASIVGRMAGHPFNPKIPLTVPLAEGYQNGTKVYFIETEVSDLKTAQNLTQMTNFPVFYVPNLTNISNTSLSGIYAFTNGLPASGSSGGGPFDFQLNIFDTSPSEKNYTNLKTLYLVTWKDPSTARLLDSINGILDAQSRGELTVNNTGIFINCPVVAWIDARGVIHTTHLIERVYLSMPGFSAQVLFSDIYNYVARLKLVE